MKFLKNIFSVVPLWQKRLMVAILILGTTLIQNLGVSEDFTNADINELTINFVFFFPITCGFYAWILSAYKKPE